MSTAVKNNYTIKDYKAVDSPRWCAGCGDYSVLVGLQKIMAQEQVDPSKIVNISGIGCSGRMPHYLNTYGLHGLHGRAIPIALGVALARPDLHLFIESGDGDAISIGGNHLIHGINKNFNCVFVMLDNEIYGLTKSQSSPTTKVGQTTMTQPSGTFLEPLDPVQMALGLGCSFVARTADWLTNHMVDTLKAAVNHKGFSFIHVAQRCPKYNPNAWDHKASDWFDFLETDPAIPVEKKASDAGMVNHDVTNIDDAFKYTAHSRTHFGLFYKNERKACYDDILIEKSKMAHKNRAEILKPYMI